MSTALNKVSFEQCVKEMVYLPHQNCSDRPLPLLYILPPLKWWHSLACHVALLMISHSPPKQKLRRTSVSNLLTQGCARHSCDSKSTCRIIKYFRITVLKCIRSLKLFLLLFSKDGCLRTCWSGTLNEISFVMSLTYRQVCLMFWHLP